ncbi:MAG: ribonuclease HII [Peptococcaceae bacterium]|nr:ribonuclease HII [Peptococcaceae bacterium]
MQQLKVKEIEELLKETMSAYMTTGDDTVLHTIIAQANTDSRASVQALAKRYQNKLEKIQKEQERIAAMWQYENEAKAKGYQFVAGTDEVGRGPLAGPVVAAAVILPEGIDLPGINDSKKLTEKQRETLMEKIKKEAISWAIMEVDEKMIDEINILEASRVAMQQAVLALPKPADYVLVDGLENPQITLPSQAIVKGDSKSISIAAASIIAKVYRDRLMKIYDKAYPGYGFAENKGYPTEEHIKAIEKLGPSPVHRMSFAPLRKDC